MTNVIWKFPLNPGLQDIEMPKAARILTVQTQRGEPFLWALVDDAAPMERREVAVVGTGHRCPDDVGEYVGTFQLPDIGLVFHVFDRAHD